MQGKKKREKDKWGHPLGRKSGRGTRKEQAEIRREFSANSGPK